MQNFVGNILTAYSKDKFPKLFNVVKERDDLISGIPTMVIGLNEARWYIADFSILQKSYRNNTLFWTYKKTERRYEYEDDIEAFYKLCINSVLEKIKYMYLDLTSYHYTNLKKTIKYLASNSEKLCFQTRNSNFLFIYDEGLNTVFGISLQTLEYAGISRRKVLHRIKQNKNNRFLYDTSFITQELRSVIGNNTHYILPLYKYFSQE